MIVSSAVQKPFSFMRFHLWIVGLNVYAVQVLFRRPFPVPMSSNIIPIFSSVDSAFRSYADFFDPHEAEFCAGWGSPVTSLKNISLWRCCFFFYVYCWPLCQNSDGWRNVGLSVSLQAIPLINGFVFIQTPWSFYYYSSEV